MWRYRPDSRRRGLYLSNEIMARWTKDLSPGDDVSYGPLRRVWTDDGSFEYHTQLSQWNLFNLRFDHFIEDQNFRVEILEKNPSP